MNNLTQTHENNILELAIIGGGISGLSAALKAKKESVNFALFESESCLGGCMQTTLLDDEFVAELGPNSFSWGEAWQEILNTLELKPLLQNPKAKQKLIYANGALYPASNPLTLFFSDFISLKTKWAICSEIFKTRPDNSPSEESIKDFFTRRFNAEFVSKLIVPLISGIYAGNISKLSMRAVFPLLAELEQKHKSLILGFLINSFKSKTKKLKRTINSFDGGFKDLILAFKTYLGEENLYLNHKLNSLKQNNNIWELHFESGKIIKAKNIVLSIPAYQAAKILPEYLADLNQIEYAPIITITVWLKESSLSEKDKQIYFKSFGFLKAENENINLLGLIFNSALFPNRSPADYVSGTAFLGGNFINESQIEIENIVKKDLLKIFSSLNENSIEIKFIKSWIRGIPQYNLGHSALITKVKNQLPDSIKLVGNYLTGISLEETIKSTF